MVRACIPAVAAALLLTTLTTLTASAENWADNTASYTAGPEFAASKALCRRLKGMSFPAAPAAAPGAASALKGCSSEALYYGIGSAPDPARALRCALSERAAPNDHAAFSGDIMLMTIYANGVGAPRDLDHATAIACNLDGAPAEENARVNHLATLKAQNWTGHDFSFCDDITSGYAEGVCAAHNAALESGSRKQRLAALTSHWSDAERRAFLPLQKAETAYVDARAGNEVDLSGTDRAAMVIGEKDTLETEFVSLLQALDTGVDQAFPATPSADTEETRLNAAYQKVQHVADPTTLGTVTKDGIRTTERAWLRYRDAWIAFAHVVKPDLAAENVRAALTSKRAAQLEAFLP